MPLEIKEVESNRKFTCLNGIEAIDTIRALASDLSASQSMPGVEDYVRFFDLSRDLFCIVNREGCFTRVSCCRVLGYTAPELLAHPYLDFVHPQDRCATQEHMSCLEQGSTATHFRNRFRDARGDYHVLEWTASAEGEVAYAVGRDLTDQICLESQALSNKQREHALLNNTPAAIYVKGIDQRYQFVNRQFAQLFQLDPAEVIGKTDDWLFPPAVAERALEYDREVVRTRDTLTIEEEVPSAEGPHTFVSVKFPIFDSGGEITATAGISTDISDRVRAREAEEELHLAQLFQRTLYPQHAPEIGGLDIAGAAFPVSQVCGDYYDFIPLGEQQVAISLGDVSGHGYKPALQMVELRTILRILLRRPSRDPGGDQNVYSASRDLPTTVAELNDILCSDFAGVPSFVSFFLASIDMQQHSLRYIGAGHEAFVIKADGTIIPLNSTGLVLGVLPGECFPEGDPICFEPGDVFAVFTDGFNEATDESGEQLGKTRALQAIDQARHESSRAMIDNLFSAVRTFVRHVPIADDMTVAIVRATS